MARINSRTAQLVIQLRKLGSSAVSSSALKSKGQLILNNQLLGLALSIPRDEY